MIDERVMIIGKWLLDQVSDLNLITMVLVPLLVTVGAAKLMNHVTLHSVHVSELILRANSLNDRAQMKMVPHKERKDQLMSMSGSSSMLDTKKKIVAALEEVINGTIQILGKLKDKRQIQKIGDIESELFVLENLYNQIPYGAKLPEIREAILQ